MATTLHVQGADIELSESFNKVRDRLNRAQALVIDYQNGETITDSKGNERKFTPFHDLTFETVGDGRFSCNLEKVIGVSSDEPKDVGSSEE